MLHKEVIMNWFNTLAQQEPTVSMVIAVVLGIVVFILILIFMSFARIWIRALMSGVPISILDIIGMKLRKVPPLLIVDAKILAAKAGIDISTNELETHFLAGGDVNKVIKALIAAQKANVDLTWQTAAAIDISGQDVLDAVMNELVIETKDEMNK